jgi:hypothetical protein
MAVMSNGPKVQSATLSLPPRTVVDPVMSKKEFVDIALFVATGDKEGFYRSIDNQLANGGKSSSAVARFIEEARKEKLA